MWTFTLTSSNYDLRTSGRRCRPVALIVACAVIVVATSFVQGDLTMPDVPFEPCRRSRNPLREAGTCPQYYYCSQRDSRCEPCSLCASEKKDCGPIAKCEESEILALSHRTYMVSLQYDRSPSCDATELQQNRLLSATCSRHCVSYNFSVLCFIGTECNASCMPPGVGRDGSWHWSSSCSCLLSDDKQLVCNWTKPLPACTNATVTTPYEATEGARLTPPLKSLVVAAAHDSTTTPSTTTLVVVTVVATIMTCGVVAAIIVGVWLRRRVMCHRRKKLVADEGHSDKSGASVATIPLTSSKDAAADGKAIVVNNITSYTNLNVNEVSTLSVGGGGGCADIRSPEVRPQVQGQPKRRTVSCGRAGRPLRQGPCPYGCGVKSPAESMPSTVHVATVRDGAGGSLRSAKCRHMGCPRVYGCGVGGYGFTADGDCCGKLGGERDDCEDSGGCSSPLLQSQPDEAIHTSSADFPFRCGRLGNRADGRRLEYAGGSGHCGGDSFDVETDAVPDEPQPLSVANEARPDGGHDWCSLTEPGTAAAVDCSCCISGRCTACSGADYCGGCRHEGSRCRDMPEGEWPDSCESTNCSDRCSADVALSSEGHSEASEGFPRSAKIVDPEPDALVAPSQRANERILIKANRVALLELISTADDAQTGKMAADLELGNVGLVRVGLLTAPHH